MTLRDAADYITSLPKAEQDLEEWQAAVESLLVVVERDGPTMLARIGIMRAFQPRLRSGGVDSTRKDTHRESIN